METKQTYRIELTVPRNEMDYVLSKMRFLGKRVRFADHTVMRERMSETAAKALARYAEKEPDKHAEYSNEVQHRQPEEKPLAKADGH